MNNVIPLFQQVAEAVENVIEDPDSVDEWDSGLPLTYEQISQFLVLATELANTDDEFEFTAKQHEIWTVVEAWDVHT